MKKQKKRLLGILLAVLMVFSLIPSAFAEGETATITVENPVQGHTYTVYRIFTGTFNDDLALENLDWGVGVNSTKLLEELKSLSYDGKTPFAKCTTASDVARVLEEYDGNSEFLTLFAETAYKYKGTALAVFPSQEESDDPYTATVTKAGYCLVVDTVGDTVYAATLQNIYLGTTTKFKLKTGTPVVEKKVKDTNDSAPEKTSDGYTDWQDSADHDIGDSVPFQFTATLPADFANYTSYKMIFHDVQSKGLTFKPKTVVVKVKTYDTDADGKVTETEHEVSANGGYTIQTGEESTNPCTFEIVIPDVKQLKFTDNYDASTITADSKVIVEYQSELNKDAVLGSAGNPNTVYLEYSTNVNYTYTPDSPDSPGDDTETSEEDTVIVFTYTVNVNKTNQKGDPLGGAEFTLYKYDPNNEKAVDGWITISAVKTNSGKSFTFTGLDDGQYKLVETAAPAGFTGLTDPIEFIISADHKILSDDPVFEKLTAKDLDGNVIETNEEKGSVGLFNSKDGVLTTTVVNTSKGSLPETGGIGTKIFYAVGGVIAITAVVLLITRKRMKNQTH